MATLVSTTQQQLGLLFDAVAAADKAIARCFAVRAEAVDRARRFSAAQAGSIPLSLQSLWSREEIAQRELSSELAATLRIPERTAETLLAESQALAEHLPATRAALAEGRISYRHAQAIVQQSWSIPEEGLVAFEQALLPSAEKLTVAKLKHKARLLRERLHPETITARHAESIAKRTSSVAAGADGMATLFLTTGAELVQAIFTRANDLAASLQGPGETRTLTQLRTDVLSDLLIHGVTPTGVGTGVKATVQVTVPVLTLLGHSEEPGYLEGYGPIDPATRSVAQGGSPRLGSLDRPRASREVRGGGPKHRQPRSRSRGCRGMGCRLARSFAPRPGLQSAGPGCGA